MAVTKTILKNTNLETVIKIAGTAGSATIDLQTDCVAGTQALDLRTWARRVAPASREPSRRSSYSCLLLLHRFQRSGDGVGFGGPFAEDLVEHAFEAIGRRVGLHHRREPAVVRDDPYEPRTPFP